MQIVIDIDEARFKDIQRIAEVQLKSNYFQTAEQIIAKGIPHETVTEFANRCRECGKMRKGHWINVNEGKWNTIPAYKCSACGANADLRDWSGESPFCPWCGAKMEDKE